MSNENNETETTDDQIICIDPIDFDPERLVIHPPQQNEFTLKSGAVIKTTTSPAKYLDDEGNECSLYFRGDTQHMFGFSFNHEMTVAKDDRRPDNATGIQICYPLTSLATVHNPKESEQALKDLFTGCWQAVVDAGRAEMEKDESLLPSAAMNSFNAAAKKEQWDRAVKFPFAPPKDKNTKKPDTNKPETIYTKLVTTGRGNSIKVSTKIYGPGDKPQSALRYIDTPGLITPVWQFEGAYHGAHGSEAPYGTSLRFKLIQANFTPKPFSRIPQNRMLPKNSAPVEEEDDTYPPARGVGGNDDDNGEDTDFEQPGGDSSNPSAALAKAAKPKAKVAAKVAKAVSKGPAPKAKTVLTKAAKGKAAPVKVTAKAKVAPKAKTIAKAKAKTPAKKVVVVEPEEDPEEEVDDEEQPLLDEEEVEDEE